MYAYINYLKQIEKCRIMLKQNYNIEFGIKKSVYKNPILRFIQNYIMPFKIRYISNIIRGKEYKNDTMQ